ncbi:MAG: chemotaxis protein CheW [Actinomycetota bacterium]
MITTTGNTRQLVVFSLGREEYGVSITRVQEIIRYQRPRPLPDTAGYIEGVINLRGRIIPVVALASRLGTDSTETEDRRIVIAELDEGTVGVTVDGVREVLTVSGDDVEPTPPGVAGGDYVEGVAKVGERLLMLIDVQRLLADEHALHDAAQPVAA